MVIMDSFPLSVKLGVIDQLCLSCCHFIQWNSAFECCYIRK